MTAPGNASPIRCGTEVWKTIAVFDVGASGAMTLKYGKGVVSCAKTGTGAYTVTFTEDVGPVLLDMAVRFQTVAADETLCPHYVVDSFDKTTDPEAPTALFEVNEIDETEALVEPASGSDCYIECTWLKTV